MMNKILENWQIFMLDDNVDDLELFAREFRQKGIYNFKCFSDYDKFLNKLSLNVIVIIIDHNLQNGKSGLDVMREAVNKIPLCYPIIVSGNESGEVIMSYMNNDAFRYVIKKGPDYMSNVLQFIKEAHSKVESLVKWMI